MRKMQRSTIVSAGLPSGKGFEGVIDFLRGAKKFIPEVTATVVEMPGADMEACRRLAEEELGVKFKRRAYDEVG